MWLGIYEAGRAGGTKEAFAVVDDSGFLGLVMAPTIDRVSGEAELGYAIAPAARGKGAATEGLRLLTEWAFAELKMVRLELLISIDNPASKRVAERCGYTLEGVMRDRYVKPGLRVDTEIWSRLATD